MSLTFSTPSPIFKKNPFITLSNSSHATLFYVIPGELAKLTNPYLIGKASGELSNALSRIKFDESLNLKFTTPPYYEIWQAHESITRELFFSYLNFIENDENFKYKESINNLKFLKDEIIILETFIFKLFSLNLPIQLIHGDLHYDNILVENEKVTGILDFEFCAMDWRMMELAICLSKYASERDNALSIFELFIKGYFESFKEKITKEEADVVPKLIILRILSNTIYFVGRAIAEEDSIEVLTERVEAYVNRIVWLKSNNDFIAEIIKKYSNC
jgi:homoserine kinase type II